jgi:hypothetical protein
MKTSDVSTAESRGLDVASAFWLLLLSFWIEG